MQYINVIKSAGLVAVMAVVLVASSACSDSPVGSEETAMLLSVTPVGDSAIINPNDPIVLSFDRQMDPAVCEPQVLLYEGDRSGTLVDVTYTWSEDGKQLTVIPVEALKSETTYTLYVGGGLRDGSGQGTNLSQVQNRYGARWVEENVANGHGPNGECETPQAQGGQHGHQHRSQQMGLVFTFTTA